MGNVQCCDNRLLDREEMEEDKARVRRSIINLERPMLFEKKKNPNLFAPKPNKKANISRFSDIMSQESRNSKIASRIKKVFLQTPESNEAETPSKNSFTFKKFKDNLDKYRGSSQDRVLNKNNNDNLFPVSYKTPQRLRNDCIEEVEKSDIFEDENPFEVNITSIPCENNIAQIEEPDLSFIANKPSNEDQLSESDIEIHEQISNSLSRSKTCSWNKSSSYGFKVRDDYEEPAENRRLASNYVTFGISRKGRITNDDILKVQSQGDTIVAYSTNECTEKNE